MRSFFRCVTVAMICTLCFAEARAQTEPECGVTNLDACIPEAIRSLLPDDFDLTELLEDPETLNRILRGITSDPGLANVLGDLQVDFKTFYSADSAQTSLGVGYTYDKSIVSSPGPQTGGSFSGFDFAVQAEGNISFNPDLNPRDFLRSKISISYFQSGGGVAPSGQGYAETAEALANEVTRLAGIDDEEELNRQARALEDSIKTRLTNQVFFSFGLAGSLESDQSFDEKQIVGDVTFGLDVKAWNPNSTLAKLNIFDWPFAVLRYLLGSDDVISPRGSNIPTVLLGAGIVDPTANSMREPLGEMSAYPRFNFEAAFKSVLLDTEATTISFQSDFRYYRELGASTAIETADLDDAAYLVVALVSSNGMFVSYSRGRLPLDVNSDRVYELGFKLKF